MTSTPTSGGPKPTLFSRDFTLFFSARTISVLGDHMLMPITITSAMLHAGYGISGVGFALASYIAPAAVFIIFGGVLVDRFTPLRVMIIADVARVGLQGGLALAFATGTPDMWLILMLLGLGGVGAGAFQPGFASVIPRIARDVQRANAAIRVTESMMMVAGPAVAGVLLALADVWIVLAIDASTFAISAVLLLCLRVEIQRPAGVSSFRQDLVEGWQEFRSTAWLWRTIVIFSLFTVTVGGPFMTLGQSVITLEHGESTLGLIMSVFGLGSVAGGLLAARIRPARPLRAGAFGMALRLAGPLVVALGLPAPLIAVGYAITGAGNAFWLVMFHTSVQTHIPPDKLGRVNAFEVGGSMAMVPIGQALAGPAALLLGTASVLYFSSAMVLVVVALLLLAPPIRNLQRSDPKLVPTTRSQN